MRATRGLAKFGMDFGEGLMTNAINEAMFDGKARTPMPHTAGGAGRRSCSYCL